MTDSPLEEGELKARAKRFACAVSMGEWETVEPMVTDDFVSSEVFLSPAEMINSFSGRELNSVASWFAEGFVAGSDELNFDGMVSDLEGHYQLFEPAECRLDTISIEDGPTAVYRLTHVETHQDVYLGVEPTGEDVNYEELGVLRFEDGLITERRISLDIDQFHEQLGVRSGSVRPKTDWGAQVKVQRQFYRVLNRLMRHNIRNDLTYVRGYAEVLAEGESEDAQRAGGIIDFANDLLETADKVRTVEDRLLDPGDHQMVEIADFVESTAATLRREHTEGELSVDLPSSPVRIQSIAPIIELVLREAVENAFEHNDADQPRVTISLETEDPEYAVVLSVADNGPGIPEHEITPLEQEVETSLEHGSGIGLWAIKWGIELLGGEMGFEENDPRGTVVILSVRDLA